MPNYHVDYSPASTLAICDKCGTRAIRTTRANAWVFLAQHAKNVHGDIHAGRILRKRSRRLKNK